MKLHTVLRVASCLLLVLTLSTALKIDVPASIQANDDKALWENSDFKTQIPLRLFMLAMHGYRLQGDFEGSKLTLIDYSRPSSVERFFVVDLLQKKLLFHCLVAHGKNSGTDKTRYFSNQEGSLKTSLGFFKTGEIYTGKHGISLKLDGLEPNINNNARSRAIVIHGANYVSEDFVKAHHRLGRSWGCPALPTNLAKQIIDTIANGTCVFAYGEDTAYTKQSKFLGNE